LGLAAAAAAACVWLGGLALGGSDGASSEGESPSDRAGERSAGRRGARPPIARSIFFTAGQGERTLIRVPSAGVFRVRCSEDAELSGTFTARGGQTMQVTVEPGGGDRPSSALLDPGKRLEIPPAEDKVTAQRWQLTKFNSAYSSVTLVFVASAPMAPVQPGCGASAYALGPTQGPLGGGR
jgi:hypothetical protein